jgi:hypothetical protein
VRREQETKLAWALISAAKPHMNVGEYNYAIVAIGVGDTFAVLRQLLKLLAVRRIPLRPQLVQSCTTWVDAYAFHEEYDHLRHLIEGLLVPQTIRAAVETPVLRRDIREGRPPFARRRPVGRDFVVTPSAHTPTVADGGRSGR